MFCIAEQLWNEVYMRLTETEKLAIHWTERNLPKDGRWSLTDLIQTFQDPEKKGIHEITNCRCLKLVYT